VSLQNSYVGALTPSTSEWNCIWRSGLYRGKEGKRRRQGGPNPTRWDPYKQIGHTERCQRYPHAEGSCLYRIRQRLGNLIVQNDDLDVDEESHPGLLSLTE
jgi:hypothetical protein